MLSVVVSGNHNLVILVTITEKEMENHCMEEAQHEVDPETQTGSKATNVRPPKYRAFPVPITKL